MLSRNVSVGRRDALAELEHREPTPLPWDAPGLSRVERVVAFLEFLPITKGIRIGHNLELLPGQRRFVERVYGRSDIRIAIKSEPRGNGKTGLISGLQLCHLVGPEAEQRGECYSAGKDRQQAALMFAEMVAILERVPELGRMVNVRRGAARRVIEVVEGPGTGSRYEALSGEAKRSHGLAPSFWAYDELAQAPNRQLLDALTTALGKRKRSLGIILSTQAEDDEHPLSQLIDDGLAGVDPSIVVDLMAAPADADVFDDAVVRACNPALGIFLKEKVVFAERDQARRLPSTESAFRNLRCNQRIAATPDLLCTPAVWGQGDAPVNLELFRDGRPVYGGLDLSAVLDLTALVLAAEADDRRVHVLPFAWTPGKTLKTREQRDAAEYTTWHRRGLLRTTPGFAIDYDYVAGELLEITAGMNLAAIAADPWRINEFKRSLARIGGDVPLEPFVQGWKTWSPAITAFEREAAEGRIVHGAHPILKWCVSNTTLVRGPAGTPEKNRKPDKRRIYGRIDLAVAMLMAIGSLKVTAEAPADVAAMIA